MVVFKVLAAYRVFSPMTVDFQECVVVLSTRGIHRVGCSDKQLYSHTN